MPAMDFRTVDFGGTTTPLDRPINARYCAAVMRCCIMLVAGARASRRSFQETRGTPSGSRSGASLSPPGLSPPCLSSCLRRSSWRWREHDFIAVPLAIRETFRGVQGQNRLERLGTGRLIEGEKGLRLPV